MTIRVLVIDNEDRYFINSTIEAHKKNFYTKVIQINLKKLLYCKVRTYLVHTLKNTVHKVCKYQYKYKAKLHNGTILEYLTYYQ